MISFEKLYMWGAELFIDNTDTEVVILRAIDMRDLSLLAELLKGKHFSKITGLAIRGFSLDRNPSTIYKRLLFLVSMGYVSRGFQIAQSDTYFITQEGIKFYEGAID